MVARHVDEFSDDRITVREAAQILRVSESTVWRWIGDGRLRSYRVGPKRVWLRRRDLGELEAPARRSAPKSLKDIGAYVLQRPPGEKVMTEAEIWQNWRELEAEIEELQRQGKPLWNSADSINEARDEYSSRQ